MGVADIKIRPSRVLFNSVDLGCTDGDLEVTAVAPDTFDVTCHQNGTSVLDQIITGFPPIEVTVTLKELTLSNYEDLVKDGLGDAYTPAAGTEVIGYGTAKQFTNMLTYAQELRFNPVTEADNLRDYVFWQAVPIVESITRSGEANELMSITFRVFPGDSTKVNNLDIWKVYGDDSQDLTGV